MFTPLKNKKRLSALFLLLLTAFLAAMTTEQTLKIHNQKNIGDGITLNKETIFADSRGVGRAYYITVQNDGKFFISLVTNGASGKEYSMTVDNQNCIEGKVKLGDGWQAGFVVDPSLTAQSKSIRLAKGDHSISFIGKGPEAPFIERIQIAKSETDAQLSAQDLVANDQKLSSKIMPPDYLMKKANGTLNLAQAAVSSDPSNPLGAYRGALDVSFNYSFCTEFYLNYAQSVDFKTKNSSVDPVMYVFSISEPQNFSWCNDDGGGGWESYVGFSAPKAGMYIIALRSYFAGQSGACQLLCNGSTWFSSAAIGGKMVYVGDYTSQGGELNFFTAKPGVVSPGVTYDTRLFTMPGYTSAANGYNDDYPKLGSFSWGSLSRIKQTFNEEVKYCLIMHYYSGYNTTVDLYAKCNNKTTPLTDDDERYFPYYMPDDLIKSADANSNYNCISWSGGRTDLGQNFAPNVRDCGNNVWYDSRGPKQCYDNFYGNVDAQGNPKPRGSDPNHCLTYQSTLNSNESIVDLYFWKDGPNAPWPDPNISENYTHATVRKPGDNYYHGYDWESKFCEGERFFHERYSLQGRMFGYVRFYYKKKTGTIATAMVGQTVKGDKEAEPISLPSRERDKLNSLIKNLPSSQNMLFENLYQAWKKTWKSPTLVMKIHPDEFFRSEEYAKFSDFCKVDGKAIAPLLMKKCLEGDELAGSAICNLKLFSNVDEIMEKTRRESPQGQISADGYFILDSSRSSWVRFVRNVLAYQYQ